jgi:phage portal protein BeeE
MEASEENGVKFYSEVTSLQLLAATRRETYHRAQARFTVYSEP